jgi:hypothetical protein
MKKIIALFAAAVMSTAAVFADFSAGARAGVGINFFEFDDDIASSGDSKVKCGFTAAVFADIDIPVVEGLVFQPEVVFARHVFVFDVGGGELEFTANTLDLPLLLGYKIKAGDSFTIMPFAGPRLSFNIGDMDMELEAMGMNMSYEVDNMVNFGITAGVSASLNVGPGSVVLDVRYNRDFTTVEVIGEANDGLKLGIYQTIDISAGYMIRF